MKRVVLWDFWGFNENVICGVPSSKMKTGVSANGLNGTGFIA